MRPEFGLTTKAYSSSIPKSIPISMPSSEKARIILLLNPRARKILVRRFYEEIINNARFDRLDEILGPKINWHDPLLPTGEVRDVESFRNILEMFRSVFPDLHFTVESQIQENEQVVLRFAL